ncbi:hypothetical protein X975_14377, partial [Stegodyphus mimosarum]
MLGNSRSSLSSQQDSAANILASDQDNPPVTKQRMRYTANDQKVSENSWQDDAGDITSSTILLEGEDSKLHSDTTALDESCHLPVEANSSHGTPDEEDESSCNTESKDSFVTPTPETLTTCTVPLISPSSLCHHSPSDSLSVAENDQNCVPSKIPSHCQNEISCVKEDTLARSSMSDNEQSSLPFSVNAFLSPLAGPRFSQSSNADSSLEPT